MGPGWGSQACRARTTGSPREGWGATHVHWQLLVAPGARATPAGAAQPPARGAAATASVRHVGSASRCLPRPRLLLAAHALPPPWGRGLMKSRGAAA